MSSLRRSQVEAILLIAISISIFETSESAALIDQHDNCHRNSKNPCNGFIGFLLQCSKPSACGEYETIEFLDQTDKIIGTEPCCFREGIAWLVLNSSESPSHEAGYKCRYASNQHSIVNFIDCTTNCRRRSGLTTVAPTTYITSATTYGPSGGSNKKVNTILISCLISLVVIVCALCIIAVCVRIRGKSVQLTNHLAAAHRRFEQRDDQTLVGTSATALQLRETVVNVETETDNTRRLDATACRPRGRVHQSELGIDSAHNKNDVEAEYQAILDYLDEYRHIHELAAESVKCNNEGATKSGLQTEPKETARSPASENHAASIPPRRRVSSPPLTTTTSLKRRIRAAKCKKDQIAESEDPGSNRSDSSDISGTSPTREETGISEQSDATRLFDAITKDVQILPSLVDRFQLPAPKRRPPSRHHHHHHHTLLVPKRKYALEG